MDNNEFYSIVPSAGGTKLRTHFEYVIDQILLGHNYDFANYKALDGYLFTKMAEDGYDTEKKFCLSVYSVLSNL